MVDSSTLTIDVIDQGVNLVLPAMLWLFVFLVAWENPDLGRRTGFGRTTFWLLLVGGMIGSYLGNLPIFAYRSDVLFVDVGGALIPIALSVWMLGRILPKPWETFARFLGVIALVSLFGLLGVVFLPGGLAALAVVGAVVGTSVGLLLLTLGRPASDQSEWSLTTLLVVLAGGGILGTYLTTQSVPEGIVSAFPYFLLTPVVVGAVATGLLLTFPRLGLSVPMALPLSYAATTFGTLLGADLLRQPPLYRLATGVSFSIGGAGLFDLIFLSGLLASLAAYGVYRPFTRRLPQPSPLAPGPSLSPIAELRVALEMSYSGKPAESIRASASAVQEASAKLRRLVGLQPAPSASRDWEGIAVPRWVTSDHENLEGLARRAPADPNEARRAWVTSRFLVHLAHAIGRPRFASFTRRAAAFTLDLLVVSIPGLIGWILFAFTTSGSDLNALSSPGFFVVSEGFGTYAFLYFVLSEWLFGTTVGKIALQLEVTNRALGRPSVRASLLRNSPKLIPLFVLGTVGGLAALVAAHSTTQTAVSFGLTTSVDALVLGIIALIGFGLPGLASAVGIALSNEAQRLGDFLAGTWVVKRAPRSWVPLGAAGPAAATSGQA